MGGVNFDTRLDMDLAWGENQANLGVLVGKFFLIKCPTGGRYQADGRHFVRNFFPTSTPNGQVGGGTNYETCMKINDFTSYGIPWSDTGCK
jgi:hypothetical protein